MTFTTVAKIALIGYAVMFRWLNSFIEVKINREYHQEEEETPETNHEIICRREVTQNATSFPRS
jgi:hypothetical protein